eukprot:tig00001249_g7777.t1
MQTKGSSLEPPVALNGTGLGLVGFLSCHVLEGAGRRLSSHGHAHVLLKHGQNLHRSGPAAPAHISQDTRAFWSDAEFEIDIYEDSATRFQVSVYADERERELIGEASLNFSKLMTAQGKDEVREADLWVSLVPREAAQSAAPAMLHLFVSYFAVEDRPRVGDPAPLPGEIVIQADPGEEGGSEGRTSDGGRDRSEGPMTPRVEALRPPRKSEGTWGGGPAARRAEGGPAPAPGPRDRESEALVGGLLGSSAPSLRRFPASASSGPAAAASTGGQGAAGKAEEGWRFLSCLPRSCGGCCGGARQQEPAGPGNAYSGKAPAQQPPPGWDAAARPPAR